MQMQMQKKTEQQKKIIA